MALPQPRKCKEGSGRPGKVGCNPGKSSHSWPKNQLLGAPPDLTFNAIPSTKRQLSLADRPARLPLGQVQPGGGRGRPAWKRAWTRVLSLSCASASAEICPGFLNVMKTLFVGTLSSYEAALEFFAPDAAMKDGMIQLRNLVDTLPSNTTENILKFTVKSSFPPVPLSSGCPRSLAYSLAPFFWSRF